MKKKFSWMSKTLVLYFKLKIHLVVFMSFLKKDPKLWAIARSLTVDLDVQEDLYQEMTIRLWQIQEEHPGTKESWYYQNCYHYAIDYLRRGKSVDSKLRDGVSLMELSEEIVDGRNMELEIVVKMFVDRLTEQLNKNQIIILHYLTGGYKEEEIGKILGISQQAVSKQKKVIQKIAREMAT